MIAQSPARPLAEGMEASARPAAEPPLSASRRWREAAADWTTDTGTLRSLLEEAADTLDDASRILENASRIFEITGILNDAERSATWRESRDTCGVEIDALLAKIGAP